MHKGRLTISAASLTLAGAASAAEIDQGLEIPSVANVYVEASGCQNHPGPTITLWGALSLTGIDGQLRFANSKRPDAPHQAEEDVEVTIEILPDGDSIVIPKQPPLGGAGGNPHIWLQLLDGDGYALSEEIYLGRCVQGFVSELSIRYLHGARAQAQVAGGDCHNSPGPWITLDGEISLEDLRGRIIFRNSRFAPRPHEAEEDVEVSVILLPDGEQIVLPKQPVWGGVGGNPHIWFRFLDGYGDPLGGELYLGRCVQDL